MKVYVFSAWDGERQRHTIYVEKGRCRIRAAYYWNHDFARVFRNWLADVDGLETLMDELIASRGGLDVVAMSTEARRVFDLIATRRKNPMGN